MDLTMGYNWVLCPSHGSRPQGIGSVKVKIRKGTLTRPPTRIFHARCKSSHFRLQSVAKPLARRGLRSKGGELHTKIRRYIPIINYSIL